MHVLVATLPILGHLLPMEVVVRALVKRGHTVTWCTWPRAAAVVQRAGATLLPLTAPLSFAPAPMAEWIERLRDGDFVTAQANALATFDCDVVLADPTLGGVADWAGETATPLHQLGIIPFLGVSPHATQLWQTTLQDCEPWRLWHGQPVTFTGPLAVPTQWTPPSWWTHLADERPRIVVTQGTLATDPTQLIAPAVAALKTLPVLPLVTADPAVSGCPTSAAWMPLPTVLPGAALFVTNGGYGGIQAALTAGVPVLVAGDTEENPANGMRVEYAGVGGYLAPPYTADRLKEAIVTVMQTPRFYERAKELQGRIPTRPAAETIADGVTAPPTAATAAERAA
jgi:UDP:flavonoid glycosyltransferase YjiC (YdhE family)